MLALVDKHFFDLLALTAFVFACFAKDSSAPGSVLFLYMLYFVFGR